MNGGENCASNWAKIILAAENEAKMRAKRASEIHLHFYFCYFPPKYTFLWKLFFQFLGLFFKKKKCLARLGEVLGCVGCAWGVCGCGCWGVLCWGVLWGGLLGRVWGRWRERVSLAALLSGYLGKSGHLPR